MATRDRRSIRYDQFVQPQRRNRARLIVAGGALAAVLAGAVAVVALRTGAGAALDTTPPPALSRAGGPVANETYRWAPVAIGGGGFISGLAMDPAGKTFVVRADVYGAYAWDARGNRWNGLVSAATMPAADRVQDGIAEGAYEVAVAPSRPDRVYMAIRGKVYRSDNRGATFTLASAGNPFPLVWDANSEWRLYGPFMAVDPGNADTVLLGTPANGLWRSTDAGRTWQRVAGVPSNVDRRPADAGMQAPGAMVWFERPAGGKPTGRVLAFASGTGMFVSANGGASFAPLAVTGAAPKTLRRGTFDRHGTFFAVDDTARAIWSLAGGRWRNLTQDLGLRASDYAAIAADPRSDRIVALDQGGAGYLSPDGGRTWQTVTHSARVGAGDPPWLKVQDSPYFSTGDVQFDPVTPNRLWVAAGTGVFFADLAPGETHLAWTSQTRGIEELVANDIVQTPGHAPLFAAWDFGIHIKHDLSAYSTGFAPDRSFIAVQQVDWSPADPSFLVTNASDTRLGCCWEDGNAVMAGTSRDGGATWAKFAALPTPPGTKASDPWRMAFGTIAVSSGDVDNIVWAPAWNRVPQVTRDGGRSWQPVVLPGAVGDNPGSFEHTWYQRKTLTADKTTPGTFYLYHSGEAPNAGLQGLWVSRDGGMRWNRAHEGEIAPSSNFAAKLRSVPGKAGHLFFTAAFAHTSDTALRRSVNGGATWTALPEVTRVDDIAFGKAAPGKSYPAIYISGRVGGAYGVWRSVDDARTWQRLVEFPVGTLDQVTVIGADPDVFGRVYLGYKGSGWVWGEPAPCQPAPLRPFDRQQCWRVGQ